MRVYTYAPIQGFTYCKLIIYRVKMAFHRMNQTMKGQTLPMNGKKDYSEIGNPLFSLNSNWHMEAKYA